jgi:hypothetical protein
LFLTILTTTTTIYLRQPLLNVPAAAAMESPISYDIAKLVIDWLDYHDWSTLSSLARVNHMISEIALDQLWKEMGGLYPLAKCIPSQHWDEYEVTYGDERQLCKERRVVSVSKNTIKQQQ